MPTNSNIYIMWKMVETRRSQKRQYLMLSSCSSWLIPFSARRTNPNARQAILCSVYLFNGKAFILGCNSCAYVSVCVCVCVDEIGHQTEIKYTHIKINKTQDKDTHKCRHLFKIQKHTHTGQRKRRNKSDFLLLKMMGKQNKTAPEINKLKPTWNKYNVGASKWTIWFFLPKLHSYILAM